MKDSTYPLVTIMIPVYNREELIEETLSSALNQDFDDYEVVVVDNKSTDNTYGILMEYARKYNNLRVFQNDRNLGPVLNWKVGIENSRGKYLKILWSDDQIDSNFLNKTVPVLKENQDIGFVYTTTIVYSDSFKRVRYRFGKTGKYSIERFVESQLFNIRSVPVSPGNALFRTKDVKKNLIIDIKNPKGLDYSSRGAGNDLLIFLMCAKDYNFFYFIDEELSHFRAHEGSISINENLHEYYTYAKIYFFKEVNKYFKYEKVFQALIYFRRSQFRYMIGENESSIKQFVHLLQSSPYVIKSIFHKGILLSIDRLKKRR